MKKLLLAVFAITIIAISCSKETKLNKRLDGEWTATSLGGQPVTSPNSFKIKFDKDKKGKGTYSTTIVFGGTTTTESGTYELDGDAKMYTLSSVSGSAKDTILIVEYSKTKLITTDAQGTADSKTEFTQ